MVNQKWLDEIAEMKTKYPCWRTSDRIIKGQHIGYITFYDDQTGFRVGTYQLLLGTLKDKRINS